MDRIMNGNEDVPRLRPGSIAGGLIVLALGTAMLLDRAGAADIRTGHLAAPLILIAIGVAMVFDRAAVVCGRRDPVTRHAKRRGDPLSGLWFIGIGAWMMVSELRMFGLTYGTSWPLIVVLSGVMMVLRGALVPRAAGHPHRKSD
jgi:putative Mn2+ efflux pump MntP